MSAASTMVAKNTPSAAKKAGPAKGRTNGRQIYVLNGPNLNLLGVRDPAIYGHTSLADIEQSCQATGRRLGLQVACHQSNHEGVLIDLIHQARKEAVGIVINGGGYSHSSVALLDALLASEKPVIEVHLSNIYRRESFRHHSLISQAAKGVICGLGAHGYVLALEALAALLPNSP